MAKYYWTTSEEVRPRYHVNTSCSEGLKIDAKNRKEGDVAPAGRSLCEIC